MRLRQWALVGVVALALGDRASAQNFQSAITGVKPSDVRFKQIDTAGLLRAPTSVASSAARNSFSLSGFFRKLTGTGNKSIMGHSTIPGPQYRSPIRPLLPINSTVPKRQ